MKSTIFAPEQPEARLSLIADLDTDGNYGARRLTLTEDRLLVADEGSAEPAVDLPLASVKAARIETFVGSGALVVELADRRIVEVVRYTQAQAVQFTAAARVIDSYARGEAPSDAAVAATQDRVCPKCGMSLPEDTRVCPACIDRRATLRRLMGYGIAYRLQAALVVVLSFTGTALMLITPYLTTKVLTDQVFIPHKHQSWIGLIVVVAIVLGFLYAGVAIWRGRVAAWLSNHMVYVLRKQVYEKLHALSISYYDKRQVGSLMSRVTQDVNELQSFLVDGVQYLFVNTLTILGILIVMLFQNALLTLIALVPAPLTVYLTWRLWRRLRGRLQRLWHIRSGLSGFVNAALTGVRVVKAFAQERRERAEFEERAGNLFRAQLRVEKDWATFFPLLAVVATLGTNIIYFFGGLQVFHNYSNHAPHTMTLGTLQLFLLYLGMLMGPIQGMTRIADWMSRSTAAAERIFEVLDADIEVGDAPNPVSMPHIDGAVELKDVHFAYDKNGVALDGVSIKVAPGEMIGLVGHSGAGKSTFVKLLLRFYDVTEGQITIDGVDIRQIKMDDLRRQIGVVLQEPFLFPGTVRQNIAYARPDASIEDIFRAAKAANAHDFVMRLPDGYDTWVGEQGQRLSGGERQRISIARAILHDPRILILDEATASVDTKTEHEIQQAISRLVSGRTTFAIAHRLSTLRNADRLLVLEKSKIAELGTHEELLAKPEGVYRKLVDMQQETNKIREEVVLVEG